jgi:phosphoglycolate phosphatase
MLPSPVEIDPLPPISAVLFDLDGTLVRTQLDFPAMTTAMREMAVEAGAGVDACDGLDILALVDLTVEHASAQGADPAAVRAAAYRALEAMEERGCADPEILPGSIALLDHLVRQDIRIGIVTRNSRVVARRMVDGLQLPHDVLLARDDVARAKPDPRHLWEALKRLDIPATQSIMVGDHPMDIQAGKAAGCAATVGVHGGAGNDRFKDCRPTVALPDLSNAIPLFRAAG